jgi:nicotinamidase-related amidase
MGVNTNSCVLATSIAASVRDYAVFVVEDGVDTMLARQLHDAALSTIDASFGWIVGAETLLDVLAVRAARRPAFEPTG